MPLVTGPDQRCKGIYVDYNATTPVDERVARIVHDVMVHDFGNPSSSDHSFGTVAHQIVDEAKVDVGRLIDARPEDIVFTSGATESINLALFGYSRRWSKDGHGRPLRLGISPTEHSAVIAAGAALSAAGAAEVSPLKVNRDGQLDIDYLEQRLRRGLDLVCVMGANNEVGTIYPISTIAELCSFHGADIFCDLTQAAGKIESQFEAWGLSMAAISAHKMYGPKGVGALVVPSALRLEPVLIGGGSQSNLRPGTLNVPGIAGLGKAAELRRAEMTKDEKRIAQLRDELQRTMLQVIPDLAINGDQASRLAGTLSLSIMGVPNKAIVARIQDRVALSTGSACSSGIEQESHVLRAMGLGAERTEGHLRISLGKFSTEGEIYSVAGIIADAAREVRKMIAA